MAGSWLAACLLIGAGLPAHSVEVQDCAEPDALGAPSCEASADVGGTPRQEGAAHVGNPIEVASGNKYEQAVDYRSISSPLSFVRHYNSALADEDRGLGHGWRHGLDVTLARVDEYRLLLVQGDGRRLTFDLVLDAGPDGETSLRRWAATDARSGDIVVESRRYVWRLPDGRRLTFDRGRLTGIDLPDGERLELEYESGRLVRVRDEHAVVLDIVWSPGRSGLSEWGADPDEALDAVPAGHIAAIVLPDGSRIDYRHSGAHTLVSVVHASEAGAEPLARYRYERRGGSYRLAAATRRKRAGPTRAAGSGAVATTRWRYDDEGLAVAQLDADGRETLSILRDEPAPAPSGEQGEAAGSESARVRHADGTERRYVWRDAQGSDPARYDARLEYSQGPAPSPLPVEGVPAPADEPLLLRHLSQLRPVPGSLDALLPAEATGSRFDVRLKATVQGGVADVRVGERSLADLQRRRISGEGGDDGGGGACQPAGNGGELLDRVATASQPCTADLVELEWLRRGAELYALRGRAARKGGLFSRDPFCELPGGKDCTQLRDHYAMAQLSGCVYPDSNPCAPGWTRIDPEGVGLSTDKFSFDRFHAELFQDSSTGRFVLVYRGTDAVNDMIDNFSQSLGITAGQYDQAMNLARSVEQALVLHHPGATLEYAGHSLGGGLATAAALDRHQPGTVFNPSELSVLTAAFNRFEYFEAPRLLEVLRVENEFVGLTHSIVGPPGEVTLIGRPAGVHFWEMLDAHGIRAVIASIKTYLDRHCPATP